MLKSAKKHGFGIFFSELWASRALPPAAGAFFPLVGTFLKKMGAKKCKNDHEFGVL